MGGSLVSGDSLDIYDDMIVAGSYRNKDVMQVYSLSQRKRIHNFDYNQSLSKDVDAGYAFSTRFSNDGNFIVAGGAGKNELKVFANNADTKADFKIQMEIKDLPSPVYTLDTNPVIKQFAFGLGNGNLYMCNYDIDTTTQEFTPYIGDFENFSIKKLKTEDKENQAKITAPGIGTFMTRPLVNGQPISSIY